jgi:hypothetical protein
MQTKSANQTNKQTKLSGGKNVLAKERIFKPESHFLGPKTREIRLVMRMFLVAL